MLQVSTGFKSRILGPASFESIFNGGCIEIRSGGRPEFADDAAGGVLLGRFTVNGAAWSTSNTTNGINWFRVDSFVYKPEDEVWAINPIATGLATWFRIVGPRTDSGGFSVTAPRIDGDISSVPQAAEMRLVNAVLQVGVLKTLDQFVYTIPPIPGA
jgi:hypothetical protein